MFYSPCIRVLRYDRHLHTNSLDLEAESDMPVRMDKPWAPLNEDSLKIIASHLGVYQLANDAGDIVYIGVADARTLFGLKGELQKAIANPPAGASQFRVEVNMAYRTRHAELLEAYQHDHGNLPAANTDIDSRMLGRLRPAG